MGNSQLVMYFEDQSSPKKSLGEEILSPHWTALKPHDGLKGWLNGEGSLYLFFNEYDPSSTLPFLTDTTHHWYVLEVDEKDICTFGNWVRGNFSGYVTFRKGVVLYCGTSEGAAKYIQGRGSTTRINMLHDEHPSLSVVGHLGSATTKDEGMSVSGDHSRSFSGVSGESQTGNYSIAESGRFGTSIAGNNSSAIAGEYGNSTSGNSGTSIVGKGGIAETGRFGKNQAGEKGTLIWHGWDPLSRRLRVVVGYVGEKGILPDVLYKMTDDGKIVEAGAIHVVNT